MVKVKVNVRAGIGVRVRVRGQITSRDQVWGLVLGLVVQVRVSD